VPQRDGGIASVDFVFAHLKDDLGHGNSLRDEFTPRKAGSNSTSEEKGKEKGTGIIKGSKQDA
jgi:hypothetical protein